MRINQLPPGLSLTPDFIGQDEACKLVQAIDQGDWSHELKRRVQHYGYRYDYRARQVTQDAYLGPLPHWVKPITRRLLDGGVLAEEPDQLIVNEYEPGQGIAAHTDCVPCFKDGIAIVSLLSDTVMEFTYPKTAEKVSLRLPINSLLILKDEARYDWRHAIPARKSDMVDGECVPRSRRVSLTIRTIRR